MYLTKETIENIQNGKDAKYHFYNNTFLFCLNHVEMRYISSASLA